MADGRYNDLATSPQSGKPAKVDQSLNNVTIALENAALSVDSPMLIASDMSAVSSAAFANDTQKLTGDGDGKPGKKPNAYRRYGEVVSYQRCHKEDQLHYTNFMRIGAAIAIYDSDLSIVKSTRITGILDCQRVICIHMQPHSTGVNVTLHA